MMVDKKISDLTEQTAPTNVAAIHAVNSNGDYELPLANIDTSVVLQVIDLASAQATIDFTDIEGSYPIYEVHIVEAYPVTDMAALRMRVYDATAAAWAAGSTDYNTIYRKLDPSAGAITEDGVEESFIRLHLEAGNGTSEVVTGKIVFKRIDSADHKFFDIETDGSDGNGIPVSLEATGRYKATTSAISGLRFYFSSGNVDAGSKFVLVGRTA